jgi:CMP-N-acetylneuraminic acid synthetase
VYQDKRVLAVVPARGGSKGLRLKNLRIVAGRPLLVHVAEVISAIPFFDAAVVSTDHPKISEIAVDHGLQVPFMRPPELSGDRVGDHPVLCHALSEMERIQNVVFDVIVMLQPTSPLRTCEHVTNCVEKLVEGGFDSVWTVSEADLKYHPLKQLKLTDDDCLQLHDPAGGNVIARQQLEQLYYRNGAAYALSRQCLVEQGTMLGEHSSAIVVAEEMVSIDTEEDLRRVEQLMDRPE